MDNIFRTERVAIYSSPTNTNMVHIYMQQNKS